MEAEINRSQISNGLKVVEVDYRCAVHAGDLVNLLDHYARDPMGGGAPLQRRVVDQLPEQLSRIPHAFSLLCYQGQQAVGLANCFEGFSTFLCQPLINIHDLVVDQRFRGRGVAQLLLDKVEAIGRQRGCCKLTLEVLEGNHPARQAYRRAGFENYQLDPDSGVAQFWEKSLN